MALAVHLALTVRVWMAEGLAYSYDEQPVSMLDALVNVTPIRRPA
jgi:hypothetical protein